MIKLRYIIDTYAWVEYFLASEKGRTAKKILENPRNTLITLENCIAELHEWCLKHDIDFEKLFRIVRGSSTIEAININDWIRAAKIKFDQRKKTKGFGLMDALILAKQSELKCKIITGDKHFKKLRNVEFLG